ncbi:prenyltransferase/squalene oxidase repeat-containing protein [Thermosipho africanus]|uniref:prenyltransferase/squalene oxidase repeat-containing protein n=1 Tax=Thermosipho africanus TaxID=2421 RepID=UPI000570E103|nr:prenyltransferase/squalene oxidase repeat-containing protein [Thermosipho africanus]
MNIACYSNIQHENIFEIVDFILKTQMDDGGWNCRLNDKPHHSSLHTTINVLEGLKEYINSGYVYRKTEILNAMEKAHEFILVHKLYKSDKTNQVIDKKMTMLSYPSRWRYDILRALDYFQSIDFQYDPRMEDALNLSLKKKLKSNKWPLQQKYPGRVFFDFEKVGKESRINTVRALRVLKKYGKVIK